MKKSPAFNHMLKTVGALRDVRLAPFSTLKVGGKATYLIYPENIEHIILVKKAAHEHGVPVHILSGGSNTLFSDAGFLGIVIKLSPSFDWIKIKSPLSISVGAATSFAKLTKQAISLGWTHAVGWSGTPGLVGGALRMNAGTRMGEIKDAIERVYGVLDKEQIVFERKEIEFGYRHNNLPKEFIITHADLIYDQSLVENNSILESRVKEYRMRRKTTQPNTPSLGSFFKNPYPSFAAKLIESCNIKGLQFGGAQISSLHANFIVNNGGARAQDILHLAATAQNAVYERFGIALSPEIRVIGDLDGPSPICTLRFGD